MENTFQNDERYFRAKNKLKKLKDFMELGFYIVFNMCLVINLVTSPDHLWFYWPCLVRIGVIIHI
jgi:hypothetical protein